jgi:HEAT repeat protein
MGMGITTVNGGPPEAESSQSGATTGRGRGTGVRALLLLIVSAGAIYWAGRLVWEVSNPILGAVKGLRSADLSRRAEAVRELSEAGVNASGEAIRAVLPVLSDSEVGSRTAGAEALRVLASYAVKSGTDPEATRAAVTALTWLLKDPDPGVRGAAARALGTIAGMATRPASGGGRGRAGKSAKVASSPLPLTAFDAAAVCTSLVDLLADRDARVREAALAGLRDCAPRDAGPPPRPLFAALDDESATNRAMAIGILAGYSTGLDTLIPLLLRHMERDEPPVSDACRAALNRIRPSALGPAAIPALIAGLETRDRDMRLRLVSLMSGLRPDPRTSVPALIKVLREPEDSDQISMGRALSVTYEGPPQQAAEALGRIAPGTPAAGEAIAALVEVVRSGPPPRRGAAAEALAEFGPAAASTVPSLISFLQETVSSKETSDAGDVAAKALGRIAPGTPEAPAAMTALKAALKSGSASTRGGAVRALGSFGPAAAPALDLVRAMVKNDPTPNVREAAASALKAIAGGGEK